ncbi:MAG TPA: hypothetical protein VFI25_00755 [Planctomycetota bacterium]|nr:hypothetical protein [Planctomycetota bacterium]
MDLAALRRIFETRLEGRVDLTVTDNRSTVLRSIPRPGGSFGVRLHRIFLDAPSEVLEATALWLRSGGKRRAAAIDRFVEENLPRRFPPPPPASSARGAVHDLGGIYERLRREHFDGGLDCAVSWARPGRSRAPRSIKFGSYDPVGRVIRVHPALDRPFVPEGFVAYILFHEMLHAALPPMRGRDGHRRHHHGEFRRRERAYPERARWEAWEKANLRRLLREARAVRESASGRTTPPPPSRGARPENQLTFAF